MKLFHHEILLQQIKATLFYWCFLPVTVLASGLLLDTAFQLTPVNKTVSGSIVALTLFMCGLCLVFWSTSNLQRVGNGTPSPFRPAKILVTTGSYRLCRHPMFFGYDLFMLGLALYCRSRGVLFISYPLFFLWSIWHILQEERILAKRFPKEYLIYRQEVAFFIPFIQRRWSRQNAVNSSREMK